MTDIKKDAIQEKDLKDNSGSGEGENSKTGTEGDEADKGLEGEIKPLLEGGDDEEITVKRGTIKKLHGVKENYKTVALSKKGKDEKKDLPDKGPKKDPVEPADGKQEFVTKEEVRKKNEKDAIKRVETILESDDDVTKALKTEINDNWDEIKSFYTGKSGKDDVDSVYEDILDAHAAWKRRNGGKTKDGKAAAGQLAAHRGTGGTSPKANQQQPARTRLLNKGAKPTEWYPKAEKKA